VDLDARATLDADPDEIYAALIDLGTYPHWLTIVASAVPEPGGAAGGVWSIELAGRLGPLTMKTRVRMVRTHPPTHTDPDGEARTVRFERQEQDGRPHNEWILTGSTTPHGEVHVHLHYGGGRTFPGADLLLRQEVRNAGAKLQQYLGEG
jgi:hypothetical protein